VPADRPQPGAPPPSPLREHDALARAMAGVVRLPAALAGVEQRLDRIESALRGLRRILPPVLLPLPEAARILGVSYATIRRMKKDGRLPLVGSGRTARVDLTAMHALSDLEATIEARRARAEPGTEVGDGEP
jgi:excisionase family DNA binding protein